MYEKRRLYYGTIYARSIGGSNYVFRWCNILWEANMSCETIGTKDGGIAVYCTESTFVKFIEEDEPNIVVERGIE